MNLNKIITLISEGKLKINSIKKYFDLILVEGDAEVARCMPLGTGYSPGRPLNPGVTAWAWKGKFYIEEEE